MKRLRQLMQSYAASSEAKLKRLLASPPLSEKDLGRYHRKPGVYLFSKGNRHLYLGRTDDLKGRIQTHRRPSSRTNQAALAYAIAKATHDVGGVPYSRKDPCHPCNLPGFDKTFARAKSRVRSMTVRAIVESDPIAQALLEIYAAVSLPTKYNDFRNH